MERLTKKYNWIEIKEINEGMSGDKKYYVKDNNGISYLLRVADINEFSVKKHEYDLIKEWNENNIPMPRAIDFGTCDNEKSVYTLLSWIDGDEMQKIAPTMNEHEQYRLGRQSGQVLKKIHATEIQSNLSEWSERYFSVIYERLDAFKKEDVHFEGDYIILDYLERNKDLLRNRPQCYHHGDYHMGNMIYSPDGKLNVIDWHTVDFNNYGDPWYEFNRAGIEYPAFASGQIDGYFADNVPDEFWKLFAFYLSASYITSIVWAKYCAPEEYDNIIKSNLNILKWFNNMNDVKPSWYKSF